MKILIVDDHPLIREALRHVLAGLAPDLTLIEAQDYGEADAAARQHSDTALILLDLGLPDVDGFEALARLRESHAGIPVVVLSASEQPENVLRALDSGAMGFIPKTSSNQLLLDALRQVLSGKVYLPAAVLAQGDSVPSRATQESAPTNPAPSHGGLALTARQSEVLALLIEGKSNKLICRDLNLSEGTVKIHVTAILKALNVANRTQAVIAVSRLGLTLPGRAPL